MDVGLLIAHVNEALAQTRLLRERSKALRAGSKQTRSNAMALHTVTVRTSRERWSALAWMSSGGANDEAAPLGPDDLLECARDAIISGKLPPRTSYRCWGGPSVTTAPCAICERPLQQQGLAYEVEFANDGAANWTVQLHVQCFLIWQRERKRW